MITVEVTLTGDMAAQIKSNLDAFIVKAREAVTTAMNMAASMIEDRAKTNIAAGGKFGGRWIDGLHVTLDNMRISMSHDIPYADVFETGASITGHPFLWLPLGDGATRGSPMIFAKGAKTPLMLSTSDKTPQLHGVSSVTIPKKWDLNGVIQSVMSNFSDYFAQAMGT